MLQDYISSAVISFSCLSPPEASAEGLAGFVKGIQYLWIVFISFPDHITTSAGHFICHALVVPSWTLLNCTHEMQQAAMFTRQHQVVSAHLHLLHIADANLPKDSVEMW